MSRFLGPIRQLGFVVPDIEAGMKFWSDVHGVGPWFYTERVPVQNFWFRGKPSPIHVSVALANSGPLQVELIQQRNDAPSMYKVFTDAGRTGLQHVAYWTEKFDEDLARLKSLGLTPIMGGDVGDKGRYVYFEEAAHLGGVIELSEISGPKGRMFAAIRNAAVGWDGSNPVGPFPDLSKI